MKHCIPPQEPNDEQRRALESIPVLRQRFGFLATAVSCKSNDRQLAAAANAVITCDHCFKAIATKRFHTFLFCDDCAPKGAEPIWTTVNISRPSAEKAAKNRDANFPRKTLAQWSHAGGNELRPRKLGRRGNMGLQSLPSGPPRSEPAQGCNAKISHAAEGEHGKPKG
jgi:ribosomal protein L37AE/L43A